MIYRRRSRYAVSAGGFHRIQNAQRNTMFGFGEGDYIRLRDEHGNVWRGTATRDDNNTIVYRFRDADGVTITGISDTWGIILRDDRGRTWRGFVD
jgi:hypothetical protein